MRPFSAFSQVRIALLAALLAAVAASACGGEDSARAECPAVGASSYAPVAFATKDNVTLCGRLYGAGQPSVVLAHMQPTDQESWGDFAETVAQQGYTALTFNFRGYAPSGGEREISKLDLDVEAAVDFLLGRGAKGIFLIGASMGGTASVKYASREGVLGVVALSAPTEFQGLEGLEDAGEVTGPKLFIAAEGDRSAQQAAAAYYEATPEPRILEIYTGSDHGTNLLEGSHATQVRGRLLEFLEIYSP